MKNNQFNVRDFLLGLFAGGFVVFLLVYITGGSLHSVPTVTSGASTSVSDTGSNTNEAESSQTMKVYYTAQMDCTLESEDSVYTLKAPEGYNSLTDQYLDSLKEYYELDVDDSNLYVVGNSTSQFSADIMLNAAPLSKTKEIMHLMYDGTETNVDEMPLSEAYTYMTTGEMPAVDSGCTLVELDKILDTQGHTYRVFQVDRDTEYYTDNSQTETTTVHSTELAAYTEASSDPMEIILYMSTWDGDEAVRLLTEFVN